MAKAFDASKFRKGITKSVKGLSVGFRDPKTWISTGNFTLNKLISGDFNKGVPLGKVTMFAGESGSGKSFICSGNLVKSAQDLGVFVVLIDSENALDEAWLKALDVDTSEEKLLKLNMAMIDDVAKVISDFVTEYRAGYGDAAPDDRPEVLFVVDSLGMLMSPTEINQFESGDMKGDFGRKAKQLKALVTNCVNMFGDLNIGLVATNHTYASQDMFDPDDKISGGCLTCNHTVLMADGSVKPINEVKVGDTVKTLDGANNVDEVFTFDDKEVFELELENGDIIQATAEHKFLVFAENGDTVWKSVTDIHSDDEIIKIKS